MQDQIDYSQQVNYQLADPIKMLAQQAAAATSPQLDGHGLSEVSLSRGESAYVVDLGPHYIAITQEGLGTKSLVTKAVWEQTGVSYFQEIAIDTVSTIVNDLITVGALPVSINAYWSSSSYDWMKQEQVASDLIKGWRAACELSGASWGGGETQSLSNVIHDGVLELAGCGVGIINPKSRLCLGDKLTAGDQIVFLASNGIQTNGLSLARELAAKLPDGYQTKLPSSQTFGEALLAPSNIYASVVSELYKNNIDIHYMSHITGHGWRKIMRNNKDLHYRITELPPVPEVFEFITDHNSMDTVSAYDTFNMGAGYAIFADKQDVDKIIQLSESQGIKAWHAGVVEAGERSVTIQPLDINYSGETLKLRN